MYSVEIHERRSIRNSDHQRHPDKGGSLMPVISVEIGPVSTDVRSALIKKLTTNAAELTSIPEQSSVVPIKECPLDAIGVGGVPLSERVC